MAEADEEEEEHGWDEEADRPQSPLMMVSCRRSAETNRNNGIQSYESMIDYVEGVGETDDNMTRSPR